ncbi:histidine kinase [Trichoderma cornu-damae]|uniref:histidine kinase n=1 Tax=Trichoderma cornu-damae TaxID=654480 RepID=A0A9P8TYB7_9HYPO|nr:histidine kinase [Trichoderma cornu-damae]
MTFLGDARESSQARDTPSALASALASASPPSALASAPAPAPAPAARDAPRGPPELDLALGSPAVQDAVSSKQPVETADMSSYADQAPRSVGGGRFLRDPGDGVRSKSQSPFRLPMPSISPGQVAFSAMEYLPVPVIILNSLKTVVLANEAMGRMLGTISDDVGDEDVSATMEKLRGQTLSQVGIDMLQDGHPIWITWEAFLDTLVAEVNVRAPASSQQQPRPSRTGGGDAALPGADEPVRPIERPTQDATVEVIITRKDINKTTFNSRYKLRESEYHAFAKMIITVWEIEDKQVFFTLTFTNTQSGPSMPLSSRRAVARSSVLEAAEKKTITTSNPSSVASSRDSSSPSLYSSGVITMSSSPFPPMGPPSIASHSQSSTPSMLQKIIRMKDALIDSTQMPVVAMWKDGSVTFPNRAARKLFAADANLEASADGFHLLDSWTLWDEGFTRKLDISEYPISILLKTETPFASQRVGMYSPCGKKIVFDALGEALYDETTHEFLAGVVTGRDVTVMSEEITHIKERDEERFKTICDAMPQLVWTARPDGTHDFFNTRWYTYTGLTPEQCIGLDWQGAFHPDDMPEARARWALSLRTGDPYVMEHRCLSKEGEWRWFLGRALAVRDKETGKIEKWFGTCTDIHESMQTKLSAKRMRQQLLSVIAHSHVTIFTVDPERRVTMLEGALIWNNATEDNHEGSRWFVGKNMYTVFDRLTEQARDGERPQWLQPIEDIFEGRSNEDVKEHGLGDRWYRTRFHPMLGKKTNDGRATEEACIDGVIGVIMDVTELKVRGEALREQSKEKRRAMANEAAAKEATRLKSQFLANMSHEIRTPITGVLGMAELLGDMELTSEQREYVDNIQSSATSLLTVINDILDFSKVESGRLDIEEVQFSLSHIVKDVRRMLQFAVERKNLDFLSDIGKDIADERVVIGDPGRLRQIITNLLTNSIKFTNQGYVRFSVVKERETAETIEVMFVIEDSGIGIEEDVRKKLFKPFSQGDPSTARRFGGTGLGLTICKNLLDLMNGRIRLESNVGSGTKATFWIPFMKPTGARAPTLVEPGAIPDRLQSELSLSCNSSELEQPTSASQGSDGVASASGARSRRRPSVRTPSPAEQELPLSERSQLHILVVEDNPVNQKIATRTIVKLGFQVSATWNGKEALDYMIGASRGENRMPDIILMDVQMPIIDGYKCTHLLRHHLPYKSLVQDVPIVAMTASAIHGDREKCTRAGMDDYLAKPVKMKVLEKMLIRWSLTRRRPPSELPASDCSEMGEHCDNADIPHLGVEDSDPSPLSASEEFHTIPTTPRLLATNAGHEPSPFGSPIAVEMSPPVRRPEGEREWSNMLHGTKLIDAAGGVPADLRNNSFPEPGTGEALTEENVNKLESRGAS